METIVGVGGGVFFCYYIPKFHLELYSTYPLNLYNLLILCSLNLKHFLKVLGAGVWEISPN